MRIAKLPTVTGKLLQRDSDRGTGIEWKTLGPNNEGL